MARRWSRVFRRLLVPESLGRDYIVPSDQALPRLQGPHHLFHALTVGHRGSFFGWRRFESLALALPSYRGPRRLLHRRGAYRPFIVRRKDPSWAPALTCGVFRCHWPALFSNPISLVGDSDVSGELFSHAEVSPRQFLARFRANAQSPEWPIATPADLS